MLSGRAHVHPMFRYVEYIAKKDEAVVHCFSVLLTQLITLKSVILIISNNLTNKCILKMYSKDLITPKY